MIKEKFSTYFGPLCSLYLMTLGVSITNVLVNFILLFYLNMNFMSMIKPGKTSIVHSIVMIILW